jgi:adenylate cyclase
MAEFVSPIVGRMWIRTRGSLVSPVEPGEPMELTALGDAINAGARIAAAAATGEILASLQVCQLAGVDTDGLEHRELNLKGKETPMEVAVLTAT